jgi:hypothetical protein
VGLREAKLGKFDFPTQQKGEKVEIIVQIHGGLKRACGNLLTMESRKLNSMVKMKKSRGNPRKIRIFPAAGENEKGL